MCDKNKIFLSCDAHRWEEGTHENIARHKFLVFASFRSFYRSLLPNLEVQRIYFINVVEKTNYIFVNRVYQAEMVIRAKKDPEGQR